MKTQLSRLQFVSWTPEVFEKFFLSSSGLEENYFVMPKEKCSDCEGLEVFKEVLLSSEALKPKLDRCLKVSCRRTLLIWF